MKKLIIPILFLAFAVSSMAQPTFNIGLKAGINNSKVSFNIEDYASESILKTHFGAFARLGVGRVFIQPEAYFSAKGGNFDSNIFNTITAFDYSTLDVPILLGIKLINGGAIDIHLVGGPVFSYLTSSNIQGSEAFTKEYFGDCYLGVQYGLGLDIWFLTFDARMEHGNTKLYNHPDLAGKNQTFMLSLGIKLF